MQDIHLIDECDELSYEFLLVRVTKQVERRVDKGSRSREACRG